MQRSMFFRAIVVFLLGAFLFPPVALFANHKGVDGRTHADTREHCGVCNPTGPDGQVVASATAPTKSREPRKKSDRPDLLGLETRAMENDGLTPVVVAQAVGMDTVQEYARGLFGGRLTFSDLPIYPEYMFWDKYGDLGRYIQRDLIAALREKFRYAPHAPATGQQDRELISAEIGPAKTLEVRDADFVFISSYGLLLTDTKGKRIDGRVIAREVPRTGHDWLDGIIAVLGTFGSQSTKVVTEAVLSVSVYTPDGDLVRTFKGVARDNEFGKVDINQTRSVTLGGVTTSSVTTTSSALLAQRLVDAAFASSPATSTSPPRTASR